MIWKAGIWKKYYVFHLSDFTIQYWENFWLSPDDPTYFCIFLSLNARHLVVVVLRSPIHANEPSEYNGMLYRTSNRVLNNGIKVIILICMDGTSQYHHHQKWCSHPMTPHFLSLCSHRMPQPVGGRALHPYPLHIWLPPRTNYFRNWKHLSVIR